MNQEWLAGLSAESRPALWAKIFEKANVKTILELGVYRGAFAESLLKALPGIERYYMLDPWRHLPDWNKPSNVPQAVFDEFFAEAMARTQFAADKRVVLRGTTAEVLDQIPPESLDAAYVDGDHTLRGIAIDLIRVFPKVKKGGIIAGDDFARSIWQHAAKFEPTLVFPFAVYFAEAVNCPIVALPFNQLAIIKDDSGFRFIDPHNHYPDTTLHGQTRLTHMLRRHVGNALKGPRRFLKQIAGR